MVAWTRRRQSLRFLEAGGVPPFYPEPFGGTWKAMGAPEQAQPASSFGEAERTPGRQPRWRGVERPYRMQKSKVFPWPGLAPKSLLRAI